MAALARLLIIGFVVCTVLYFAIAFFSRAARREQLEASWVEEGRPGDREAYVQEGLTQYENSLRRKLIWGVYVLPMTAIALLVYFVNFH